MYKAWPKPFSVIEMDGGQQNCRAYDCMRIWNSMIDGCTLPALLHVCCASKLSEL